MVTLRPPTLGDLGWVLHRHATVYAAEFGWDATFEELCARIIAEYTTLRDAHPDRTAGWIAEVDGVPGRLGLLRARQRDHRPAPPAAGRAVGPRPRPRRHPRRAVPASSPARSGYADITLWTYDRLAAARKVYQAAGFTLASEYPDDAFGHHMMSQTWSRPLETDRSNLPSGESL